MKHHPTPVTAHAATSPRMSVALQRIRAEERALLAQELHDELGALLMAAKLDVAGLQARCVSGGDDMLCRFTHLAGLLDAGLAFKTRVVEGLHPAGLLDQGLRMALTHMARDFERSTDIAVHTHLEDLDLDAQAQHCVFRLVQECLTNVGKHAHATQVSIEVRDGRSQATVAVSDNGVGFNPGGVAALAHGLAGMRRRIEAIHGRLSIDSAAGKGTRLVALLPHLRHSLPARARRSVQAAGSAQRFDVR